MKHTMKKYQGYLVLLSLFAVVGLWTVLSATIGAIVSLIGMAFKIDLLKVSGVLIFLELIVLISGMTIESYLVSRMMREYSKEFKESCESCKHKKFNLNQSPCNVESNLQKQVSRLKKEKEREENN